MTESTTTPNVTLMGKVHLPHPTKRVKHHSGPERVAPLCGQRSKRFYPAPTTATDITCEKCLHISLTDTDN